MVRWMTPSWVLLLLAVGGAARANEDEPIATEPPVPAGGSYRALPSESYYSPNLRCNLLVEWMYIDTPPYGQVTFWGARIVGMDVNSPLRGLPNVNLGDVITRLDGVRISRNMYRQAGQPFWSVPQVERHYGTTEVRWIRSGTNTVLNSTITLGNPAVPPSGPVPVPVLP